MKIKKSKLKVLIENFLLEDKTSDALRSINVVNRTDPKDKLMTDAMFEYLGGQGFNLAMIGYIVSFLGVTESTVIKTLFVIYKSEWLPLNIKKLLMEGLVSSNELGLEFLTRTELSAEGLSSVTGMMNIGLSTVALYSILPNAFFRSLEQSGKIQNSIRKMKEIQEYRYRKSQGRFGVKKGVGFKLEDLNEGAMSQLVLLFMDDEKSANEIIDSLLEDKIIDNEVVVKVMDTYRKLTASDYLLVPNETVFTEEFLNDVFYIIKFLLIISLAVIPSADVANVDDSVVETAQKSESAGKTARFFEKDIKKLMPNFKKYLIDSIKDLPKVAGTGAAAPAKDIFK